MNQKRVLAGVCLTVALLGAANYDLHAGLFGAADKTVMTLGFVLLGVDVIVVGPTPDELRRYREQRRTTPRA